MFSSWLLFSAHFACQLTSGFPHQLWSSISQIIPWHCWTKISYLIGSFVHQHICIIVFKVAECWPCPMILHSRLHCTQRKHYLPIFSGSQIVQAPECSAPVNIWHGYHHESPSEVLYHLRQKILSYPKLQEPPKICQGASKRCASDMKLLFISCERIAISQLFHWKMCKECRDCTSDCEYLMKPSLIYVL